MYFQGKIFTLYLVNLVVLNFDFDLVSPFYFLKWNCYFSACTQKFAKFFMSFLKTHVSFPINFAPIFSAIKHNASILVLPQKLYTLVKSSSLKCIFFRFPVLGSKFVKFLMSILNWQVNSSSNFESFFTVMTHNLPINFKLTYFLLWIKGSHQSPNFYTFQHALVKICWIPHVIFESQFSFKFCINVQYHQT